MIKRLYPLLGSLIISVSAQAQSSNDALLYSPMQPSGTARIQALGGAGVGLGGDYSSAHLNPAGIALFKTGEVLFSAGLGMSNNTATYQNNNVVDNKGNKTNFQIPNIGVIFANNKNSGTSSWNNITFSLGFNRLANYNNQIAIAGRNNISSYTNTWVDALQGKSLKYYETGDPVGASLAYYTYLVDTLQTTNGNFEPLSLAAPNRPAGGKIAVNQMGVITRSGGLNDITFAIGGNYGDKIYIGGSVNIPSINYKETFNWIEGDATSDQNFFHFFEYNKYLRRNGLGIGAKLGMLCKLNDRIRVGAAFQTPTYYTIRDSYSADLYADTEQFQGVKTGTSSNITSDGGPKVYDYSYVTPLRLMGGASYFIGDMTDPKKTQGFISADYEYVNQAAGKFKMNDAKADETILNDNISAIYRAVSNVRIGAEIKFLSLYAVRGGFAAYGNPYSSDDYNAGISGARKIYSGGIGVRNKGLYVDLTYSYTQGNDRYRPYVTQDAALTPDAAKLVYTNNNIILTTGLKF